MTPEAEQLWLGAFVGAQVLMVFFCAVKATAYRERALMLQGAAAFMALVAVQAMQGQHSFRAYPVFLLLLALSGLQLLELVSHGGALRLGRRALLLASVGAMPALALGSFVWPQCMPVGMVVWTGVVLFVLFRAWPQSQPWIRWLAPGLIALIGSSAAIAWEAATDETAAILAVAGLLAVWSACTYLATGWRGRIFGETRARVRALAKVDPLTGLSTLLVIAERIRAARNLTRRYGHPSVVLLVHIENLPRIVAEFGPEAAEAAVLASADRVRQCLRDGDVAARLAHSRIAVLAEGLSTAEGAANIASRILVAGLKEPLAAAPTEFLQFRIVQAAVPVGDEPASGLLARLAARLEQDLVANSERRIVTLSQEDLLSRAPEPSTA